MVLLDTGTPGTSREIYSEDADGEIQWLEHSVYNRGVASSSLTISLTITKMIFCTIVVYSVYFNEWHLYDCPDLTFTK